MAVNTFLFMGRSGSGKGTQVKILADKKGYKIFEMGSTLRCIGDTGTTFGNKIKEVIDTGIWLPSWIPNYLFQKEAIDLPTDQGIIYDGMGRKLAQAEIFNDVMEWLDRDYVIINLDVSRETILKWVEKRKGDEQRADDTSEGLQNRFDEYDKYAVEAIEFFREKGKVIDINGDQPMEKVSADIWEAVEKVNK